MCQTNASILHPFPVAAGNTNCKISKIVVPLFTASAPKLISSEAYINLAKQAKVVCSIFNFEECKLELLWPGPMPPPQRFNKSVAQNTSEIRSSPNLQPACAPQMCTPSTLPSDSEAIWNGSNRLFAQIGLGPFYTQMPKLTSRLSAEMRDSCIPNTTLTI